MANRSDPELSEDIHVLAGIELADLWDRFEVFEALHHSISICNPMTSSHLDELVEQLVLAPGDRVLDIATGSGELLLRCAEHQTINGIGIDLSPWMIARAHNAALRRVPNAELSWVLGEARDFVPPEASDAVICIGAEWVWHGIAGTARALVDRVRLGGVVILGGARLHALADQDEVRRDRGYVETIEDVNGLLAEHGLDVEYRIDPTDGDWDAYLAQTRVAAMNWAERQPGPRAQTWLEAQIEWHDARDRDRDVIGWSAWVARRNR